MFVCLYLSDVGMFARMYICMSSASSYLILGFFGKFTCKYVIYTYCVCIHEHTQTDMHIRTHTYKHAYVVHFVQYIQACMCIHRIWCRNVAHDHDFTCLASQGVYFCLIQINFPNRHSRGLLVKYLSQLHAEFIPTTMTLTLMIVHVRSALVR